MRILGLVALVSALTVAGCATIASGTGIDGGSAVSHTQRARSLSGADRDGIATSGSDSGDGT